MASDAEKTTGQPGAGSPGAGRVALITYHAAHNNGSFLQAYATQRVIRGLGYDCDIIDFATPRQRYLYDVYKTVGGPRDLLKNLYALAHHRVLRRRHRDFTALIRGALRLTAEAYDDPGRMGGLEGEYDVFVSGSDQIWNMDAWDYSDAYALSFVRRKPKISYASSLGGHILDKRGDAALAERYRRLLGGYRSIAVRERAALDYLRPLIDRPMEQVVDPTLLLEPADYASITASRLVRGPYLFYYAIDAIARDDAAAEAVRRFARERGLPVVVMVTGNRSFGLRRYGFRLLDQAAPNHFLSLVRHADHVVTSSFHGTAFSVLFGRQFHVAGPGTPKGGAMPVGTPASGRGGRPADDRIASLLDLCGLDDRRLPAAGSPAAAPIDYAPVWRRVAAERARCTAVLQRSLDQAMGEVCR